MASSRDNQAFQAFLRRVWRQDVAPLLRDKRAAQRRKSARVAGKLGAAAGLAIDGLLGLKGRPFARFATVMGSSLGALLPDVWDWEWLRAADSQERQVLERQVAQRAAELPEADALAIFELPSTATRAELKAAWHAAAGRWHPDKARDEAARSEHHVRFVTYQGAYERLVQAYDAGRLPLPPHGQPSA